MVRATKRRLVGLQNSTEPLHPAKEHNEPEYQTPLALPASTCDACCKVAFSAYPTERHLQTRVARGACPVASCSKDILTNINN